MTAFSIIHTQWKNNKRALSAIREAVFITEQHIPKELEWDGEDSDALHLLVFNEANEPVGCARLLEEADALHLGRLAVLQAHRNQGIGQALIKEAIIVSRARGYKSIVLDAQTNVVTFYSNLGFKEVGPEFLEAGIPHRHMVMDLSKS